MQRPVSQLANGILRGADLPIRNSTPGAMETPVGVCMTVTTCLLLSRVTVQLKTTWLVFCWKICSTAAQARDFGASNSLQVTTHPSNVRISVRVGIFGGGAAGA